MIVGMADKRGESACLWDEAANRISTNWSSGEFKFLLLFTLILFFNMK